MATIYISSTYSDLKDGREKVYRALRQMRHDVIAMEDYVATDKRSPEKCLADVEQCDLYIGIFAWRYGYIPEENNPEQKSITEQEYRKAVETNKSPLIFLLAPDVMWHPQAMDAFTSEGEHGERIKALREELQAKTTISFFRTFDELAQLVSAAVSNWAVAHSSKSVSLNVDEVNRRKYLENMSERYGTVKLPIGPPEGFYLHAVFQPLMLRRDPLAAEDLERKRRRPLLGEVTLDEENLRRYGMSRAELERMETMDRAPVQQIIVDKGEDALAKSPQKRVVILGGPGTGKTTTLKYLAGQRAQMALASPDVETPIFFSLAAYAQSGKTLQRYLVDVVEDMKAGAGYAEVLWKEIEAGRAFLCLDSLDEVAPNDRPRVIEQVNSWAADKGNTWIVGSRFTEYKGGQFKQGQFAEWELLPMNSALRRELARRLLPELQRLLKDEEKQATVSAETFVDILEHHSQAAAWGENPLLFSLAAVVYLKIGHLPSSRAALYREVIEAVLKTREHDPVRCKLLERLLTDLALWLHQRRGRTFTMDDLIAFLLDLQRKTWGDTTDLIHRIISSGIVEIVARDTYAFRHQTFQEYLAAVELARRLTAPDPAQRQEAWDLAWSKRTYSRWTEILRLIVGILVQTPGPEGPQIALRWLQSLLAQRHHEDGDPGSLGLALALKSLTEVSEMEEWTAIGATEIEEKIIFTWLHDLTVSAQYERIGRVQRLHALVYDISFLREQLISLALRVLKHELYNRKENVRTAIVHALGRMRERLPLNILFVPLQDKSSLVQNAAREVLNEQGARLLHEPIFTEGTKHENSIVRSAAIGALGKQGKQVSLDIFMQALQDKDSGVRSAVIEALGEHGEQVPLEVFVQAIEDEYPEVRSAAVEALGKQGERVPLEVLIKALEDEDGLVRYTVVEALSKQGERAPIEVLIKALEDGASIVRNIAMETLGKQGERVPLEVLIKVLEGEDSLVRSAAVEALGEQGERVPLEVLIKALEDEDSFVRSAAVEALSKQGERVPLEVLVKVLEDEANLVRNRAIEVLSKREGYLARSWLLNTIKSGNWRVWSAAVEVLRKQGEQVPLDILIRGLEDKASFVRSAAVEALSKQGEQMPLEVLIKALKDEANSVRYVAVEALGKQGERVPLEVLIKVLEDEDGLVRYAVVEALSKRGEQVPLDILIRVLEDETNFVRSAVIKVLGEQGKRVPLEVLIKTLEDKSSLVRSAAVKALGEQGTRVPLEVLIKALEDKSSLVRSTAVKALSKQGERMPLEVLMRMLEDEDRDVRSAVVETLGEQGKRVDLGVLIRTLEDENSLVRYTTVRALGEQGERVPLEVLNKMLEDENSLVRSAVVEALGRQGERVDLEVLIKALEDEDSLVRYTTVRALGEQEKRVSLEVLIKALEDEDSDVRYVAVEALSKQSERVPHELLLFAIGDDDLDVQNVVIDLLHAHFPRLLNDVAIEARAILQGQEPRKFFGSITNGYLAELIGDMGYVSSFFTEQLLPMLDWHYWQVRMKAARALGQIRRNIPDGAIQRLLELRHDPVRAVREAADDALGEILSLEAGMEDEV